jgi:hypothetical protein
LNKDIIHKAIQDPELLMSLGVADLEKISVQYPYFNAVQMLLAKAYKRSNDHRYTDQLHHAAVYSNDRRLYDWIRTATTTSPVARQTPPAFTEKNTEPDLPVAGSVPEPAAVRLAGLILDEEIQVEHSAPTPSAIVPVTPKISVQEKPEPSANENLHEQDEKPVIRFGDFDAVEGEILLSAMQRSMEMEVSEDPDTEVHTRPVTEDHDPEFSADPEGSYAAWMLKRSRELHFSDEKKSALPAGDQPQAVSDWIRQPAEPCEEATNEEDAIPENPVTRLSHGVKRIHPESPNSHQRDLIDRFIRIEPQITRGRVADYTSGNLAKDSLEEDLSLITETMALLFARQGKLEKARKAYKKLMELHPEKSIYFAAQLKNLDKLKKQ